mmetsp:Transcript_20850/g.38249  ORF Transcript_20850/g.38249 Transcript_20850/m.38249 type:complete len:266 (+) Transcript_20850:1-798(+)
MCVCAPTNYFLFLFCFFNFRLAFSSGLRRSSLVGPPPIVIISSSVRSTYSPCPSHPWSVIPANATLWRDVTSRPRVEHILRICLLRPSLITKRSSPGENGWLPSASLSQLPSSLVFLLFSARIISTMHGSVFAVTGTAATPSLLASVVIITPSHSCRMSSSVAIGSVITWYSFDLSSPERRSGLTTSPLDVSRISPVLSASSLPIGYTRRDRDWSTSMQFSLLALASTNGLMISVDDHKIVSISIASSILCSTRRSVVQTTPRGL